MDPGRAAAASGRIGVDEAKAWDASTTELWDKQMQEKTWGVYQTTELFYGFW